MCAVTRQVRPTSELIRFVVAPTGEVVADLKRNLPGRGLWLTASRSIVEQAVRRRVFARGFKRDVKVAPALATDLEALLVRSVIDALSIAAKASQVVSGFGKVESALKSREAVAVIHATDGAADGIRKLDALRRAHDGHATGSREIPRVDALMSHDLDLALGRSNVIHAALLAGSAGQTFLSRCQILVRYRLADDGNADAAAAAQPIAKQNHADDRDAEDRDACRQTTADGAVKADDVTDDDADDGRANAHNV
ncbi:RNA-binding protein [Rhodopseudomonas sp. B29]|uniref:RNA-binding protein n=1 Tax=Rhodopseudomonas sp. B29 TaxID=95607 RepID=UPI0035E3D0D4